MPRVSRSYAVARRDEILLAARRCFARDGFHATSMDDVIKEAGLSSGVVYRWFAGKDELVHAAVAETLAGVLAAMDQALDGEPPGDLAASMEHLLTVMLAFAQREGFDLTRVAVHAWAEALRDEQLGAAAGGFYADVLTRFRELVIRHRDAGALDPNIDAEAVARPLFSMVLGYILQRLLLGELAPATYADGVRALIAGATPASTTGAFHGPPVVN